jgi:hypothetical protein
MMMEADGVLLLLGVEVEMRQRLSARRQAAGARSKTSICLKFFYSEVGWQAVSTMILCTRKSRAMVSCVLYALWQ